MDSIYLLVSGAAEVRHVWIDEDGNEKITSLATIESGGSIGLGDYGFYSISGVRSATVTASSKETALLRLSMALFNGFALMNNHVLIEMQKYAEKILQLNL